MENSEKQWSVYLLQVIGSIGLASFANSEV